MFDNADTFTPLPCLGCGVPTAPHMEHVCTPPMVGDWVTDGFGHVFLFIGIQAPYPFQSFDHAMRTISNPIPCEKPEWATKEFMSRPVLGGMGW